ncbi:Fic family protein [uncultured Mucilaginibacter sp.]|uniref:Fic family protein n=1 Tax=uncultured Mucilaginibacter sp. TaxID=797541 RepID=UPI00262CD791|nr:Fic family protein [uncultured Mucilaginibacter sp.]
MDLRLEAEFSKTDLTKHIDSLKNRIEQSRPLPQEIEDKVMQKLRLEWNYHSNAIEGNRLNYGETVAFLMTGITAKGKSLKDHLDIRGHNEAILFLLSIVKDKRDFTETDIRALHEMILVEPYDSPAQTADGTPTKKRITLGEYKTSANHVKTVTGETHYYASPEETPAKMQELMNWYRQASVNQQIHPLVLAALFHYKFVSIHPFDDGNGRLSRILMNLILMRNGFPPVVIKMENRQNYYALLNQADTGNYWPFIEYIGDYLTTSLNLYFKAIEGEDIDEAEDIDKEIALFKLEIRGKEWLKAKKSNEVIEQIMIEELDPFFNKLIKRISQFKEFFFSTSFKVITKKRNVYEYDYEKYNLKKIINFIKMDDKVNLKLLQLLDEEEEKHTYASIIFMISLNEFKSLNKNFSIFYTLNFVYNEYNYTISEEKNNFFLTKLYHENFLEEEQTKLQKNIIQDIKNNIQKNL